MRFLTTWLAIAIVGLPQTELFSQQQFRKPPSKPAAGESSQIHFAFDRTPWRDVVRWIADQCELALHFEDLPTGSFSYDDPRRYTPQEAIDRVNLFLLPQGYTLVRSGQLLSVINLSSPRSMQQLDALARMVTVEELEALPDHDVVKTIFPLGELEAEDAVEELQPLNLLTSPAVFSKTNQLMITDTVSKLRNVAAVIRSFQPKTLDNGTVMKSFALRHADAEDILLVARPHLGLATGEMIGIDVSLSADLQGKHIFVTGVEDKVKLIEGLVEALDRPQDSLASADSEAVLQSHAVAGNNVSTIYNVLQTLLAGKSLRLSMDEEAGTIVALASPEIQAEITQTVAQLQAESADFEVIPLETVDPYFAISLLEEMLDLPDAFDDPDDIPEDAPKIDADPGNMRLFVRAKRHQIDQIKKIVAGLDSGTGSSSDQIRLLPIQGSQAETLLETVARFWQRENPIILYPQPEGVEELSTERVVGQPTRPAKLISARSAAPETGEARFLTNNLHSQAPAIRCQLTARGLLLQCEDSAALDELESQLRTISGPLNSIPSPPIVFYLKYTKPNDALRMLAELLDGGETAKEAEGGKLVNGLVSPTGSYLGSLVTSRDGTMTMMAGTITVVADTRLNRLIAQGTSEDIARIESYINIVDKDSSITSIETYGSSHVIELQYTQATEVAATIREAFAGRVSSGGTQPSNGGDAAKNPQREAAEAKNSDEGKKASAKKSANAPTSQPVRDLEPKMTLAVHEPSNSLIVTAPKQLFEQVESLVRTIDTRSEQSVEIISPTNANLLRSLLSPEASSRSGASNRSSTSGRSSRSSQPSMADLLRSKLGR